MIVGYLIKCWLLLQDYNCNCVEYSSYHSELFSYCYRKTDCLHSKLYQPHSIPQLGSPRCHKGPKIQSRQPSPLTTPEKISLPKLKIQSRHYLYSPRESFDTPNWNKKH